MNTNTLGQFQLVRETGWRRGLGNLLQGEWSSWFKSSRWWKHLIVWFSVINVMMGIMIIASVKEGGDGPPLMLMYGIFGGMCVAMGVMVIMQRVLVREKSSGTAAWVLSKPVTRTAFVVSRLLVNTTAILLTSVIVPGFIFYISLGFSGLGWVSPLRFAAALLMVMLHTFYWIALLLMMGTLSESSSVVIGAPIALYFGFWLGTMMFPQLIYISPLSLTFVPSLYNSLAGSLIAGETVFSWLPLISTVVSCIIFIPTAIWRFNRQEF